MDFSAQTWPVRPRPLAHAAIPSTTTNSPANAATYVSRGVRLPEGAVTVFHLARHGGPHVAPCHRDAAARDTSRLRREAIRAASGRRHPAGVMSVVGRRASAAGALLRLRE